MLQNYHVFQEIQLYLYPIAFYLSGDYLYKRLNNPELSKSVELRLLHEVYFPAWCGRFADG